MILFCNDALVVLPLDTTVLLLDLLQFALGCFNGAVDNRYDVLEVVQQNFLGLFVLGLLVSVVDLLHVVCLLSEEGSCVLHRVEQAEVLPVLFGLEVKIIK